MQQKFTNLIQFASTKRDTVPYRAFCVWQPHETITCCHLHLKISTGRSTLEDGGSGHLWTLVNCQRILHGGFVCLARTSRLHVTSTEVAGERMLSKEGLPPCYFLNILSRWAWNKPLQRTCWTRWRKGSRILTKWLYCEKTCRY